MLEKIKTRDPKTMKAIKIAATVVGITAGAIVAGVVLYKTGILNRNTFVEAYEAMEAVQPVVQTV